MKHECTVIRDALTELQKLQDREDNRWDPDTHLNGDMRALLDQAVESLQDCLDWEPSPDQLREYVSSSL